MAKTNDEALGTLASLLGVKRGKDGRYAVRLSDEAKADGYINAHIVVGGVPRANDKRKDDGNGEEQEV